MLNTKHYIAEVHYLI